MAAYDCEQIFDNIAQVRLKAKAQTQMELLSL